MEDKLKQFLQLESGICVVWGHHFKKFQKILKKLSVDFLKINGDSIVKLVNDVPPSCIVVSSKREMVEVPAFLQYSLQNFPLTERKVIVYASPNQDITFYECDFISSYQVPVNMRKYEPHYQVLLHS